MSESIGGRPPQERDCVDCGEKDGMRLRNIANTERLVVPLLYMCDRCHASLTIPPPFLPPENVKR